MKYFKRNIADLAKLVSVSVNKIIKHVKKMIIKIINTCQKHRQKSRKNSLDVLIEGSIYKNYKYVMISQIRLKSLIKPA